MTKIIFEFVGGPMDGKVLHGVLGDASDAERYYLFTNHGAAGQRFKVASEYAVETLADEELKVEDRHRFQPHHYVVSDRLAEGDEILVRAEYVEPEAEKNVEIAGQKFVESESAGERIYRSLKLAAKSMASAYSHCWPAEQQVNLVLHLGHVLLGEDVSVFVAPRASSPVDLVGISPNQDWFLACVLGTWGDTSELLVDQINGLESFRLNSDLTIPACADHVIRVGEHCRAGFGLIAGLHWTFGDAEDTPLLSAWRSSGEGSRADDEADEAVRKLRLLNARWVEPLPIQTVPRHGTCFLLSAFFRTLR